MSLTEARSLLLVNCGQLLTLRGPRRPRTGKEMAELGLIRNGALLIRDRIVAMVGPGDRVSKSQEARGAIRLDARGNVVLPGFVDSHTHALFAAPRVEDYVARIQGASYAQIARAGGGIRASARRVRSASERVLADHLKKVIGLFLEYGTTTVEVKSGYGLELVQEVKMLRAIRAAASPGAVELVPTLLAHDLPVHFTHKRARYLELVIRRLIPQVAREGLAECFDVFCDRGFFSVAEAKELLGAAAQAGFKLKLHAEQLARTGAARMAAGLNAISVDHLDHLTDAYSTVAIGLGLG
ncbi:MAG: imidazolonepropionase, partial [Nitrospirota bacterium]